MRTILKYIYNFFKNNPIFAISITLGIIYFLYSKWHSVVRITKQIIEPMIKEFQNPLDVKTWVTSKFGSRIDPVTGKAGHFHNGIDLHAPSGTPIFAPMDGVAYLSINTEGGNQLVIHHTNGYKTGYAHLSSRVVSQLQVVKKGQLIAYSGNSGAHTTAAHLHFTVTNKEGRKIDPLSIFNLPLKA